MAAFASTHPVFVAVPLPTDSNLFMTVAWYGHVKNVGCRPCYVAEPYMGQGIKRDHLWTGLWLLGAGHFIFAPER